MRYHCYSWWLLLVVGIVIVDVSSEMLWSGGELIKDICLVF